MDESEQVVIDDLLVPEGYKVTRCMSGDAALSVIRYKKPICSRDSHGKLYFNQICRFGSQ